MHLYSVVFKCLCSLLLGCTFECLLMCFLGCFNNVVNVFRVHYVICFHVAFLLKFGSLLGLGVRRERQRSTVPRAATDIEADIDLI